MNGTKRRSQSGLVLIVTLLVALGLSLIGAIIMERTRTDTATSGSLRAAEQTAYVSEIGTMVSMRTFALNYSMYRRWMTMGTRRNSYAFDRASFDTPTVVEPTLIDKSGAIPGSLGYTDLAPDYDVLVNRPYEYGDAAGYSVSGTQGVSFCFRRYTFTSAAQMAAMGAFGGPRRDSRAVMRATTVVGPTDCTM